MDVVLHGADKYVLDGLWSKVQPEWGRDHLVRQSVSVRCATHARSRKTTRSQHGRVCTTAIHTHHDWRAHPILRYRRRVLLPHV